MPSATTIAPTVFVLSLLCAVIFCSVDLACAAPAKMLHNSQNLGTKYGTWGTGYTCETCHEKTLAAKNIKKVKSNIATQTGIRPVAFNRYTGRSNDATGIFGNDERTVNAEASRNICEVCHHLTAYHQYSASKIADKKHTEHKSNLRDCTSCHRHNVGYKPPSSQECDVCHGYPPVNNGYYGGPAGMVSPPTLALGGDESVPPSNVGAHDKHRNVLGFECQVCHNSYEHGYAGNDMIEFGFRIDQSTWPPFTGVVANGEITATNAPSFRGQFAVAPGNAGTTLMRAPDVMSCNVYCHGGFWNYDSGGAGSAVSWVQGPLGSCDTSSCHGTTRSNPPTPVIMGNVSTGAHKTHVGKLGNDGSRCASCHDEYFSSGRHMVNGHVKVNLSSHSPSATYKGFNQMSTAYLAATGTYGSCSNLYCHSNVQTPDGTATASSFTTVTWGGDRIGCDGCHGGVRTDASPIATGAHVRHVAAYAIGCGDCHNEAGNDHPTRHADASIDIAFSGTLGGSYSQAVNTPGNGFGSCSANYCHSDGNGITTTVGWGAGTQSCTGCHKADLASGVPIDTGAHSQHVDQAAVIGKNLNCAECHATTVNSGMTVSTVSNHVNRFKDFSGALAGRTRTACSTAYCHSDGKGGDGRTVDWSTGPALGCDGCHGADSAPYFVSVAGEPNYANTGVGTPRANSHQRHMGGKGATSCIFCHSDTVDASGALTASTLHLDTVRSVAPGGGRSFSYDPATRTCSTISCHGGPNPAQWGESFPSDCTGCHGNNAESSIPQTTGKHAAHMNNASVLGTNYGCATCHALTVSSDRTIADPAFHGNGFKNYTGPAAGSRSSYTTATGVCSASYCHTDGKGAQKDLTLVNWKSAATLDCKGCHGSDDSPAFVSAAGEPNYASAGAGAPRANSHQNHVDTGAATCSNCHGETVTIDGSAIAGNHTNTQIDVVPGNGKGFVWGAGGKTCSDISCHGGKGSFTQTWGAPLTSNCLGCHGNNVASGIPISSGSHTSHVNNSALLGSNYSCIECHAKTINPDERSFSFPANHGNGYRNFSGVHAGGDATYLTTTGVCSASYCHTDGKGAQKMSALTGWNSGATLDCRGCHGSDAAPAFGSAAGEPNYANEGTAQPRANSHQKHVGTNGPAATCIFCHGATVSAAGTEITGNHADQLITVSPGGGKAFSWTEGTKGCAGISCHGAGSPSAQWGQTFPADCTGCHGGGNSSSSPISTGRHAAHVSNSAVLGSDFGCAACHSATVTGDTTLDNTLLHANGFANFSGGLAGTNATSCATAYCHSDGKGGAGRTVDWSAGPALGCDGCHGAASGGGSFTSIAGEPNYAAETGLRSNSHDNHTKKITGQTGAASCDICHTDTVIPAGTALKAGSLHLNRQIDVGFNRGKEATALWAAAGRTCSNIACHNGGSAVWGDASSAGCRVCHPSLTGAHSAHVGDLMSGGLVTLYNYTANRSSGSVYRYGCATCHPTDLAMHRNGTIDIDVSSTKTGGGYLAGLNTLVSSPVAGYTRTSPTQFTCDLVYCHSNGKSHSQVASDYRQSPNWYGGAFSGNRCGMCHDNPPQYAGQSHYVADSTLGDNGRPTAWESGHMIGIHFRNTSRGNKQNGFLGYSSSGNMAHGNPAYSTAITCSLCHSGVVSSTQIDTYAMHGTSSKFRCENCHTPESRTPLQPGRIIDASLHINGAKDVAFAPVSVKTKAQLSNVANALGWGRQGTYKGADSYDSFDLSVSSWNPQTKTCLTACHVNQPGITWGAGLQCFSCHANQ